MTPDWTLPAKLVQLETQHHADVAILRGSWAMDRLLERVDANHLQAQQIVHFVLSLVNSDACRLDLALLQKVETEISADMIACMNALRWGAPAMRQLLERAEPRIAALARKWSNDRLRRNWLDGYHASASARLKRRNAKRKPSAEPKHEQRQAVDAKREPA